MADGETIYAVRIAYPQYLDRGRPQTARLPVYYGSALAAPLAGTYALLDSNGTTLQSGNVAIVDQVATFALEALSATQLLGYGYREQWTLTMPDGTVRVFTRDAVVIRNPLYPVVTDEDLFAVYDDLRRQKPSTISSFEVKRNEAWKRILDRLEESGNLPNLIVTPWSLRESHLELSLHLILQDLRTGQQGRWETLALDHKREFEFAWARKKWQYATDDVDPGADGTLTGGEGTVWATLPPATSWDF